MSKLGFGAWFAANSRCPPHEWQARLGEDARCGNRLIRVPSPMNDDGIMSARELHDQERATGDGADPSWAIR